MGLKVSRALILILLLTCSTLITMLLTFDLEITSIPNQWIILIVLVFVAYIFELTLRSLEKKYALKNELSDIKTFLLFELIIILICTSVLVVLSHPSIVGIFKINKVAGIASFLFVYIAIAILPNIKKRTKIVYPTDEEKKALEKELYKKIDRINHRYDSKTGSIETAINYQNHGILKTIGQWRTMDRTHATLVVTINRPISSMPHREREIFRIYELMNIDHLNEFLQENLLPPLIWANGKGITDGGWKYSIQKKIKDRNGIRSTLAHNITEAIDFFIKNACRYNNFEVAVAKLFDLCNRRYSDSFNHPAIKEIKKRLVKGNAWMEESQFDQTGFTSKQPDSGGVFLGEMKNGSECWFAGEGAVLTVAPPGSGKTQTHILPNLLTWNGPAVVLDVKGELWEKTAGFRKENIGSVYRFAPLDPDHSHHFNPLLLIRNDEDHLWEDSKFLADMIVIKGQSNDPFWDSKAQELITAAIAVECMDKTPKSRDFGNVISSCYGVDWNGLKNKMLDSPIRSMQNVITSLINLEMDSRKTLENIRQQAQSFLSVWEGAKVERAMKESDWHPNDLRTEPATIYIGLKAGEIDTYSSVLRVFIAQHIRTLIQELPPHESQDILFVLDEFPRLKFMAEIEEALEIGRQFKIKIFLAVQSMGQIKQHYKNADGLIGACAVRAFMNPSSHDGSAEKISKELGKTESIVDGSRHNVAEMTDLDGPEYANDVIILSSGNKPIRATKHFAYQDEELTKRMSIPAPIINRNPTGRLIQD